MQVDSDESEGVAVNGYTPNAHVTAHPFRRTPLLRWAVAGVLGVALTSCHSASTKNGEPVHEDAMKARIISVSRSVLAHTGIKTTGGVGLGWESCTDDNTKPFGAVVATSFLGQRTLEESERQVDQWVAALRRNGWGPPRQVPHDATRYLAGPDGFSMSITPHLNPEVQSGADLMIRSQCVVSDDVGNSPGYDVTKAVQP